VTPPTPPAKSARSSPTAAWASPRHTGVFVAFEGGDGAGKSTQVRLLAEALRAGGHDVLETRQPGGTDLGNALRDLVLHGGHVSPRAEALIYAADKAHHVDTVIRPALAAGRVVLTDRYVDSATAYQGGGRDLGAQEVARLQRWAVGDLVPDLTIVLDVTPQAGRQRRGDVHDRLEAEGDAFHQAVREHFLTLAAAAPERYLVVDAERPPGQIHAAVVARLAATGLALEPAP
jgi:dTMP kinase